LLHCAGGQKKKNKSQAPKQCQRLLTPTAAKAIRQKQQIPIIQIKMQLNFHFFASFSCGLQTNGWQKIKSASAGKRLGIFSQLWKQLNLSLLLHVSRLCI